MAPHAEPIAQYPSHDPFGIAQSRETAGIINSRRKRRIASRKQLTHRVKNGVYDPISYYHVVDFLVHVVPDQEFRSIDLTQALDTFRPVLAWDTTTVGRIMGDLADTFMELDPNPRFHPVEGRRKWNGMHYMVHDYPEARALLFNLLDDLGDLSEQLIAAEGDGTAGPRVSSPLQHCPTTRIMV